MEEVRIVNVDLNNLKMLFLAHVERDHVRTQELLANQRLLEQNILALEYKLRALENERNCWPSALDDLFPPATSSSG